MNDYIASDPLLAKILIAAAIACLAYLAWAMRKLKEAPTFDDLYRNKFEIVGHHGGVSDDVRFGQALGVVTSLLLHIEQMLLEEGIHTLEDVLSAPEHQLYTCPICAMPRKCAIHDQVFDGNEPNELKKLALKKLG